MKTRIHENPFEQQLTLLTLESRAGEAALQDVSGKLPSQIEGIRGTKRKRIEWPLSIKETEETISFVHRYVAMFHAAMDVDTNQKVSRIDKITRLSKTRDILDWLCKDDPSPKMKLNGFLDSRSSENSGQWLLENERFKTWKSRTGNILWLRGDGGVGKTILASRIIQHLFDSYTNSDVGIAFIYFDYTSTDKTVFAVDPVYFGPSVYCETSKATEFCRNLVRKMARGWVPRRIG